MQIRPPRDDDFEAIAAITNHYIATTAIHFGYEPITAGDLRAHRGRYPWFVADEDGHVLGYAKAASWRDRAAYQWTCEVAVYVADGTHRRGIGTQLYTVLLDELARRGFRSAVAGITLPNEASIELHRKLGFVHVGTFVDAGYKLGAWYPVDWWQKRFATAPDAKPGWDPATI